MNNEYETYERNGLSVTIKYDIDPENPRDWDNLGTMIFSNHSYNLGDEQFDTDQFETWAELQKYLKKERDAAVVLPVSLYNHSGVSLSVGEINNWDSGQVGFIYVTQEDIDREYSNTDLTNVAKLHYAETCLRQEVETYSQYLEGDIYGYTVTNPITDEEIDSCWGLYGIEYAREEANVVADEFIHPKQAAYAKNAQLLHN